MQKNRPVLFSCLQVVPVFSHPTASGAFVYFYFFLTFVDHLVVEGTEKERVKVHFWQAQSWPMALFLILKNERNPDKIEKQFSWDLFATVCADRLLYSGAGGHSVD